MVPLQLFISFQRAGQGFGGFEPSPPSASSPYFLWLSSPLSLWSRWSGAHPSFISAVIFQTGGSSWGKRRAVGKWHESEVWEIGGENGLQGTLTNWLSRYLFCFSGKPHSPAWRIKGTSRDVLLRVWSFFQESNDNLNAKLARMEKRSAHCGYQ